MQKKDAVGIRELKTLKIWQILQVHYCLKIKTKANLNLYTSYKRDKSDLNDNSTVVIKNIKVDYSVKDGDAR